MGLRGVIFDLDGTLYAQAPVRARMAVEVALHVATHPLAGSRAAVVLRAYRRAQEVLRARGGEYTTDAQVQLTAEHTGMSPESVSRIVNEWMFERPLKHLARHRDPGILPLLQRLAANRLRLGVLSDYAAAAKLKVMGLESWFPDVWCAGDPGIRALKPSPKGFLAACRSWRLPPEQVLVVGDRADVDGAGAAAAGIRSVIVGRASRPRGTDSHMTFVSSLEQVGRAIDDCR